MTTANTSNTATYAVAPALTKMPRQAYSFMGRKDSAGARSASMTS
jgi:hypothetical protein